AAELDAVGLELVAEQFGVLDDAVVDDRDAVVRVGVGVRIGLVRLTVGGPAGVAEADGGLASGAAACACACCACAWSAGAGARGLPGGELVAEVLDAARGLGDLESAKADDS